MLARTSLILTLILSLLFVSEAQPQALPVEMKPGGSCAGMDCRHGCCMNMACCRLAEQQKAPQTPAPASQHQIHLQVATIWLRAATLFFQPLAGEHRFVILDETSAAHTRAPLAVSCIRLI